MPEQKPIKIAIIGGGCASIAAAFELSRPEHQGKFEITIYQLGWRLGGKGASGRGPAGRIEEHGFHVWFGFYENAFRLMRECYAELGRERTKCRIADWRDAFSPAPFVGLSDLNPDRSSSTFLAYFPPADGLPGDPDSGPAFFSIQEYVMRTIGLLRMMLTTVEVTDAERSQSRIHGSRANVEQSTGLGSTETYVENAMRLLKYGVLVSATGLLEALGIVELLIARTQSGPAATATRLLESVASIVRRQVEAMLIRDSNLLLTWHALDLGITATLGVLRHGLLNDSRGFDAINDYDFREWMRLNGACESSLDSPLIRALYDLAFAYEDGDYSRPRHAAGVALRGTLRMLFTYRGAFIWKLSAGMGDVVFAPFYEVLNRRGVRFQFFHRLERLRLAPESKGGAPVSRYVEALDFDVQAEVKDGSDYMPLIDLDGLPCWPSRPDYTRLAAGRRLEREGWKFESHWDRHKIRSKTLRIGRDFDFVVLGVGLGAIPNVAAELVEGDPRWRDLVTHVKTIETQCFQIWLKQDMAQLGWNQPQVALSAFAHPFETWADMSHLIAEERWPTPPGAIAYFCSAHQSACVPPLSDRGYYARRLEQVRRNAVRFLNQISYGCGRARGPMAESSIGTAL